jgi:hypothetical protein
MKRVERQSIMMALPGRRFPAEAAVIMDFLPV